MNMANLHIFIMMEFMKKRLDLNQEG